MEGYEVQIVWIGLVPEVHENINANAQWECHTISTGGGRRVRKRDNKGRGRGQGWRGCLLRIKGVIYLL